MPARTRSRRTRSLLVGAAAIACGATAPAGAEQLPLDRIAVAAPDAGPAFVGREVAWTEHRGPRDPVLLVRRRRGLSVVRPLPRRRPPRGLTVEDERGELLLGAGRYLALIRNTPLCGVDVCTLNPVDLLAGRAANLSVIRSRRACRSRTVEPGGAALAGPLLAYAEIPGDCRSRRATLLVRDLRSRSAERVVARSANGFVLRGDGRFLGVQRTPGAIDVLDTRSFRRVRTVRARALGATRFLDWDVQADGKVAAIYEAGRRRVTGASWFGHAPRRLGIPALARSHDSRPPSILMAGDRIAFLRPRASDDPYETYDLIVSDLRGRTDRAARFGPPRRLQLGGIAFDGRRLAFAAQRVDRIVVDCPAPGVGAPCVQQPQGPSGVFVALVR